MADRSRRGVCRECGARLAADNRGRLCSPCARNVTVQRGSAPQLPDAFWDSAEIVGVLAQHQFGKLLRAYRKAQTPEIKQTDLAVWLGLTQGQVSRIERGDTPTRDLDKLDRWARTLRIPQRCLWFTLSPDSPHAYTSAATASTLPRPTSADSQGGDVHRRQFLATTALGVGASLLRPNGTKQPVPVPSGSIGSPEVDLVREMTGAFRRIDNRYGGAHSRTAVTSYITSTVEPMLTDTRAKNAARSELFGASAELHQLAGWMAYDTGQAEAGRRHLRTAFRLCQEAGDDALGAEMLAGMSHHAAFHGSPDSAVDLALAARQTAKRVNAPALHAEAAVMEAHGLALRRDKRGSLTALREAETLFTAVDPAHLPTWLTYFDAAYLAAKFAHTFRDLGMAEDAEAFARRSLEMSAGYERGRLFNTALLASILADQGKVDESCAHGSVAVQMTGSVRSVRSAAYLADLARRLAPYGSHVGVGTLYRQMFDVGIPVPTR